MKLGTASVPSMSARPTPKGSPVLAQKMLVALTAVLQGVFRFVTLGTKPGLTSEPSMSARAICPAWVMPQKRWLELAAMPQAELPFGFWMNVGLT